MSKDKDKNQEDNQDKVKYYIRRQLHVEHTKKSTKDGKPGEMQSGDKRNLCQLTTGKTKTLISSITNIVYDIENLKKLIQEYTFGTTTDYNTVLILVSFLYRAYRKRYSTQTITAIVNNVLNKNNEKNTVNIKGNTGGNLANLFPNILAGDGNKIYEVLYQEKFQDLLWCVWCDADNQRLETYLKKNTSAKSKKDAKELKAEFESFFVSFTNRCKKISKWCVNKAKIESLLIAFCNTVIKKLSKVEVGNKPAYHHREDDSWINPDGNGTTRSINTNEIPKAENFGQLRSEIRKMFEQGPNSKDKEKKEKFDQEMKKVQQDTTLSEVQKLDEIRKLKDKYLYGNGDVNLVNQWKGEFNNIVSEFLILLQELSSTESETSEYLKKQKELCNEKIKKLKDIKVKDSSDEETMPPLVGEMVQWLTELSKADTISDTVTVLVFSAENHLCLKNLNCLPLEINLLKIDEKRNGGNVLMSILASVKQKCDVEKEGTTAVGQLVDEFKKKYQK